MSAEKNATKPGKGDRTAPPARRDGRNTNLFLKNYRLSGRNQRVSSYSSDHKFNKTELLRARADIRR